MKETTSIIMFDIDGTLITPPSYDARCFTETARSMFDIEIPPNVSDYVHATHSGILDEVLDRFQIKGVRDDLHNDFKNRFSSLIMDYLEDHPEEIQPVRGASEFFDYLKSVDNINVAIATGGWEEIQRSKLRRAGINVDGVAFASSDDNIDRVEIMRLAESKALKGKSANSKTYFGDAEWDRKACEALDYRFILVGNQLRHKYQINDFQNQSRVLSLLPAT